MQIRDRVLRTALICLCAASLAGPSEAKAESVADFYKGKTITLSVGYSAGGAYDGVARILARHMPQYIPGNPTIIIKNAPGAGSLSLTNQLYNVTPRDGTQFGIIARGMATKQVARQLGISPKTCDHHIQRLYRKTGLSTRAGATLFALEHGLVDPG